MKVIKKILLGIILLLVSVVIAIVVAINVSPKPFIFYLKHNTVLNQPQKRPKDYQKYRRGLDITHDVSYQSKYPNSKFDIFMKRNNDNRPTIIWAHGGGFVLGDKVGTDNWAMKMASSGYNVVSINYSLAPTNHYPDQVNQMADAIRYVTLKYGSQLNTREIVVGGDSAGAHIASQVIAAQVNSKLAEHIHYQPVKNTKIVGGLLYCGPYNLAQMTNIKSANTLTKIFINQIGWAYLGHKNWQASRHAKDVSTVNYVNPKFPPIFITDGNNGSFESQGKELSQKLLANKVKTKALFFDKKEKVNHEYQFDLDTKNAKKCFNLTLDFLTNL